MTVTIVCDVLGKENNGTSVAAFNLIRSLRERGHTVRIVCPDEARRGQEGFFIVPVYNLLFLNEYVKKNGVSLGRADKEIIRSALIGSDAVHIMTPFSLGICAAKLAKAMNIAITAGFHCQAENFTNHIFLMNSGRVNNITYSVFYHVLYQYCDAIHYPTEFICRVFEARVGATNHYIISNGVSKEFRKKESRRPPELEGKQIVLFSGRYSREKSHPVLIDAAARCAHSDSIQLIFAGAGPREEELKKYCEKTLKTQPIFKFYQRSELIDVINYCDLYVHPAEIEIEAISCLEAISCGLVPVISNSPRSATRYFALTENNLFKCNDPDDLAKKIDYWLDNPDKMKECADRYLGYASRFDFDSCMDKMEQMIKDAVAMHNEGH